MRPSTVALWSLALWSSGHWLNPAYASAESDTPEALPLPNLSSAQKSPLSLITLATLPSELEQAIALDSAVVQPAAIEWTPTLPAPTFVNTPELSIKDGVRDGEAFRKEDQAIISLQAIASPRPVIAQEVVSRAEWSVSSDNKQWDTVDVTTDGEAIWTDKGLTTAQSFQAESGFERVNAIGREKTFAKSMAQPNRSENALATPLAVNLERNWPDSPPATSNILNVTPLSRTPLSDTSTQRARGFIEPLAEHTMGAGFPDSTPQRDKTVRCAKFEVLLNQNFVLSFSRSSPIVDVGQSTPGQMMPLTRLVVLDLVMVSRTSYLPLDKP